MENWKKIDLEYLVKDCESLVNELNRKFDLIKKLTNMDDCIHEYNEYQTIIDGEVFKECIKCGKTRKWS